MIFFLGFWLLFFELASILFVSFTFYHFIYTEMSKLFAFCVGSGLKERKRMATSQPYRKETVWRQKIKTMGVAEGRLE